MYCVLQIVHTIIKDRSERAVLVNAAIAKDKAVLDIRRLFGEGQLPLLVFGDLLDLRLKVCRKSLQIFLCHHDLTVSRTNISLHQFDDHLKI
jgi:hypothetical protein